MSQLEFDDQEREMVTRVLKSFLSELRTEVTHTDTSSFRDELKAQEALIERILAKLEGR